MLLISLLLGHSVDGFRRDDGALKQTGLANVRACARPMIRRRGLRLRDMAAQAKGSAWRPPDPCGAWRRPLPRRERARFSRRERRAIRSSMAPIPARSFCRRSGRPPLCSNHVSEGMPASPGCRKAAKSAAAGVCFSFRQASTTLPWKARFAGR